jgi:hypothetical protein
MINASQAITDVKPQPPYETEQTEKLWHCCSGEMTLQAKAGSILTIVILMVFINSIISTSGFKKTYKRLTQARKALLSQNRDAEVLKRLHPSPERIKTGIEILKKYKLSVFRDE